MDLRQLADANAKAIDQVEGFRLGVGSNPVGTIDSRFHWHKNHFPYFGFVQASVDDLNFVMFSANDDLVAMTYFWYGPHSYERLALRWWIEEAARASTAFDIGAFSGVYSLAACEANPSLAVYAFEPARRSHARLLANLQANRLTDRATALAVGMSSRRGPTRIKQYRGEQILGIGASIGDKDIPITDQSETVDLSTVDDFCGEQGIQPDLAKIDVEGLEEHVLDGAAGLLEAARPRLLIEVTPATARGIFERLSDHGYSARLVDEARGRMLPFTGATDAVRNVIAVPSQGPPARAT